MKHFYLAGCFLFFVQVAVLGAEPEFPAQARRILFLGDSITYAGEDVVLVEAGLLLAQVSPLPEVINLGLSSETVSGLSEPTHPFPRPGVHERLDRALEKIKPDVVVACYGMNDGIYAPFSQDNFQAYQTGIHRLIEKVHAAGAKLVLLTPPPFDSLPLRKAGQLRARDSQIFDWTAIYENYDEDVIAPYARWIMQQRGQVEMIIDLHGPVIAYLADKRRTNPDFTMSGDGVHLNAEGHRILAEAILSAWQIPLTREPDGELLSLIRKKQSLLKHAWLSEVGHLRPGVPAGLPIATAEAQAAALNQNIQQRQQQLQK